MNWFDVLTSIQYEKIYFITWFDYIFISFILLFLFMFAIHMTIDKSRNREGFLYRSKDYNDISSYLPPPFRQGRNTWKEQAMKDYEFYWDNIGFQFPNDYNHDQYQLSLSGEFVSYAPVDNYTSIFN